MVTDVFGIKKLVDTICNTGKIVHHVNGHYVEPDHGYSHFAICREGKFSTVAYDITSSAGYDAYHREAFRLGNGTSTYNSITIYSIQTATVSPLRRKDSALPLNPRYDIT